jgi:hypothetical protein
MQWDNVRLPRMEWENVKPAPGRLVVVQRFVNTRTYLTGGDLLAEAEEATTWLTEHGLLGAGERLDEAGRRRLLAFREVLRGATCHPQWRSRRGRKGPQRPRRFHRLEGRLRARRPSCARAEWRRRPGR